jgi:hypothetical protein
LPCVSPPAVHAKHPRELRTRTTIPGDDGPLGLMLPLLRMWPRRFGARLRVQTRASGGHESPRLRPVVVNSMAMLAGAMSRFLFDVSSWTLPFLYSLRKRLNRCRMTVCLEMQLTLVTTEPGSFLQCSPECICPKPMPSYFLSHSALFLLLPRESFTDIAGKLERKTFSDRPKRLLNLGGTIECLTGLCTVIKAK